MLSEQLLLGNDNGTTNGAGAELTDITASISDALGPIIWLSVAVTIIFVALYLSSIMRKRKVENAILDIQKTLHEMNERDKARSAPRPMPAPQAPAEKEPIIAKVDTETVSSD